MLLFIVCAVSGLAQTTYWTNATGNNLWNTAGNWDGGAVPAAGSILRQGVNPASGSQIITLGSDANVAALYWSPTNNFTINGNTLTLSGSVSTNAGIFVTENSAVADIFTINSNLAAGSPTFYNELYLSYGNSTAGSALVVNGNISAGSNQLVVSGATTKINGNISGSGGMKVSGTVTLSGANTYSGTTLFNGGTLRLTNAQALGSSDLFFNNTSLKTLQVVSDTGLAFGNNVTMQGANAITVDRATAGAGVASSFGTLATSGASLAVNAGSNVASGTAGMTFGATSINGSLEANVGANANLTLGALNDYGNAYTTLTKDGSGTLTLSAPASNWTGSSDSVSLNNGTIRLTGDNVFGAGSNTTLYFGQSPQGTTALLDLNGHNLSIGPINYAAAGNYNANITTGTGTLTLLGNVTYAVADPAGSTIAGNLALTSGNHTFQMNNSGNWLDVSANISGSGGLTGRGTGILLLSGNNTFSGGVSAFGGTIRAASSTAFGTGTLSIQNETIQLAGDTALNLTNANSYNFGAALVSDRLTAGAGVTHNLGALNLTGGDITVAAGANVTSGTAGIAFSSANITDNGYSSFNVGANALLAFGALNQPWFNIITKSGSGTLQFNAAATSWDSSGNALIINGGLVQLGASNALGTVGTSNITVNDTLGGTARFDLNGASQSILTLTFGGAGATATSVNNVSTGSGTLTLQGRNSNIVYDATSNPLGATLSGNLAFGPVQILTGADFSAHSFTVGDSSNATADLTVSANISSTIDLYKFGAGTLVFSGNNTYTGKTFVSAGVLNLRSNTALGTTAGGTTVSSGAALQLQGNIAIGAEALTLNGTGIASDGALRNISGNNSSAGAVTLNTDSRINSDAGTLTLSGGISGSGLNLTLGGAGNTAVSGAIGTGAGTLTKDGAGTVTLSGANTYTGATTIGGGVLSVSSLTNGLANSGLGASSNAAANLVLNGGTLRYTGAAAGTDRLFTLGASGGSLDASGTGAVNFTNTGAIVLNGASTVLTLTGTNTGANTLVAGLRDNRSSANSLVKSGIGTWVLSGTNSYSGGSAVNAGTLVAAGSSALGSGAVTVASGSTLQLQGDITLANVLTLNGSGTAGNGALESVSGYNTASGAITLGSSSRINSDAGSLTLSNTLANGGAALALGGAGDIAISGDISGAGSLTKDGAGTLTLSGNNTYTGATVLNGGLLSVSALADGNTASSLGASTNAAANLVLNGGTLQINNFAGSSSTDRLFTLGAAGGVIDTSLTSTVDFTNSGAIGFATPNTAATLTLQGGQHLIGGAATLAATLGDNGTGPTSLTKAGVGSWNLTGLNSYTGVTSVNGGTLIVSSLANGGGASGIGASSNSAANLVLNGGTLQYTGATAATDRLFTLGTSGGSIQSSGTGPLTLTNTGTIALTGSNQARTLTLIGSNSGGDNTLAATLGDNGSGATSLSKFGNSTWVLTGNNTYTGGTSVSGGILQIGAGGTSGSIQGNVSNFAQLVFNRSDNLTFNGLISNYGTLTQNGSGTLTLGGASTYTGVTTINSGVISVATLANGGTAGNLGAATNAAANLVLNSGTLRYTGAAASSDRLFTLGTAGTALDASGSGALNLTNTGAIALSGTNSARALTLTGTNTGANTLAAVLANNGLGATSLVKSGVGTWVLSGNSSYTGGTAVNTGTLVAAGSNALGTGAVTVATGSTLQLQGNITVANALTLNGTGTAANGALESVSGNNTASGAITLGAATRINSDAGTLTLSNTLANGGNALTLGGAGDITANGIISGAGFLTKDGAGTATLSVANTYTGSTTINAGRISVTSLANGGVASGLGASSNAAANLVLSGGSLYYLGSGASTDRLFTLGAGSSYLNSSGTGALNFTNTGALALSGTNTARTFFLDGTNTGNNTFSLLIGDNGIGATSITKNGNGTWALTGANNYTGVTSIGGGVLSVGVLGNGGVAGGVGAASNAAANLYLSGGTLRYTGAAASSDRLFTLGTAGATLDASGSGALNFANTGAIAFSGSNSSSTLTLTGTNTGANTLASVLANNGSGKTSLVKSGIGTWVLGGNSTYSGGTAVNAGTLVAASSSALGTGAITVASGSTLQLQGNITVADTLTLNGTGTASNGALENVSGNNTASGALTLGSATRINSDAGLLTLSNNVANGGFALTLGGSGSTAANGIISGTGSLTKDGAGTATLSGTNTYTGTTTINGGVLAVTKLANGGAASGLGASSNAAANLVLNGGTLRYTGLATVSTDRLFTLGTAGGTLDASSLGALNFTNSGSIVLSGTNTARTLTLAGGNAVVNTLGLTLGDNGTGATTLVMNAPNFWALTGNNTYTGGTIINNGWLVIGHGGTSGSILGDVTDNGELAFERSDTFTYQGVISGTGGLDQTGTGTLILSGNNTYTGNTWVEAGTLLATTSSGFGSGSVAVFDSATLQLQGNITVANALELFGTGTAGNGALENVSGNNTASGAITLDADSRINSDAGTLTLSNTLDNAGHALTLGGAGNLAASGVIAGAGSLTKDGTGTATLAGASTYSGGTAVNAGTLVAAGSSALGTGTVTVGSGATLQASGGITLNNDLTLSGTGTAGNGAFQSVSDNTTLNGDITLSGNTRINSDTGTLTLNGNIINNPSALTFGGTGNIDSYAEISGAGSLTKDGAGTATLYWPNTYTGATIINGGVLGVSNIANGGLASGLGASSNAAANLVLNGGTLRFVDGGQVVSTDRLFTLGPAGGVLDTYLAYSVTFTNSGAIAFSTPNTATTLTLQGASGPGFLAASLGDNGTGPTSLVKSGTGAWVLTGANTYTGGTTINAGVLYIGNGGTTGSVAGNIVNNADLYFERSDNLAFGGIISGSGNLSKYFSGTLTLSGANTYTGTTWIRGGVLSVSSLVNGGVASNLGASSNAANRLQFSGGTLQYTGGAASTDRLFTLSAAAGNALDASGSGAVNFTNTGAITLSGTNTARSFTLTGSNTGANTLAATLGNNGTGKTSLVKSGVGTWVLSSASTYSGGTAVNAGTLVAARSSALGTGAITVASGSTLQLQGNITVANALTLNGSGTASNGALENVSGNNTASRAITLGSASRIASDAGTLTLSNTLANGGYALTLGGAGNTAANGVISGSGALTKDGTGTATLAGANTYTGATTISGGVLSVTSLANGGAASGLGASSNAAANLVLNGGTLQFAGGGSTDRLFTLGTAGGTLDLFSGGGVNFTNSGSIAFTTPNTATTLTLQHSGLRSFLAASLGDNGTGATTLVMTQNAPGTWVLTGNNTYTGGTVINNSQLFIGYGGTSGSIVGDVSVDNTLFFDRSDTYTFQGSISGTGDVVQAGTGTLILSGNSTYTGTTWVQSGTLLATTSSGFGSGSVAVFDSATLQLQGNITVANALFLNGTGTAGNGALENLSGNNTASGAITLEADSRINSDAGTLTLSNTLDNAGHALTLGGAGNLAASGVISGTGSLTKDGAGTATLSGTNTYTGTTTINGGVLAVTSLADGGTASGLGASSNAASNLVLNGGTLQYTGSSSLSSDRLFTLGTAGGTLDGAGTGTLSLTNTGAIALSGTNTARTLTLTGTGGTMSFLPGLYFYTTLASSLGDNGSGATSLVKNGSGSWTLTGNNTYTGGTTINAGVLYVGAGGTTGSIVGNITNNASLVISRSDNLTATGIISGSGTLTKNGTGTLTLTGLNTYTGATTITGGILSVASLGNGGSASNLGAASNAATNLVLNGATLQYTGATASTDRLFSLGTINGNTLDASGTGAISFTNTGAIGITSPFVPPTLNLSGTNAGANTLAASLGDNGSRPTGVAKSGTGTWVLSGNSAYSGGTALYVGTLVAAGSTALGTGAVTVASGSTLQLQGNITLANALALNGTGTASNGALENVSGNNTASGAITLGSATRINSDAGTLTLDNNVANGGYALTLGGAGDTTGNGIISGTGSLTKDGAGTVTLTGTNTYTGATIVNGGVLTVTPPDRGGVASGIGASSNAAANLVLNGGRLDFQVWDSASTDRLFTLGTAGGQISSQFGQLDFTNTGDIVLTGTNTARNLALIGYGSLAARLGDNGTGATSLLVTALPDPGGALYVTGAWTLTGANTYTGATTIANNTGHPGDITLSINSLANGGIASAIGASSNAAANLVLDHGSLLYTGVTTSTDRLFTLGTGGGAIINNGSGSLNFTNTGAIALSGTNAARTLLLSAGTAANTLAASLGDNGTGRTSLVKSGIGSWVLSGNSTYSGGTAVNAGTLVAAGSTALGTGAVTVASGSTLQLQGGITVANALTLNGTGTASNGALENVSGNNTASGALTLGSATRINSDAGTLTLSNTVANGGYGLTLGGAGNTVANEVISGTGSLTKDGAGTVTLAADNNYTGVTTINGGVLSAGSLANGGSASSIGASSTAASNLVLNGGTLDFIGDYASTDRLFTLGTAGGTLTVSYGSVLTFVNTGDIALSGTNTARTLNLTTDGGAYGWLSARLGNNGTGATSVVLSGDGGWTLDGANTYTGATTINGGTLFVESLANGGLASGIGASSNAAANLVLNGGTLSYWGSDASTDRLFTLGTNGGTISAYNSGLISFTNTGDIALSGTNTARTLTLGAEGGSYGSLAARLGNNGTGATSLVVSGYGGWTLTGNNTYTGATSIIGADAQLTVSNLANGGVASNIGASSSAAANLVIDGGLLQYNGYGAVTNRLFTLGTNGGIIANQGTGLLAFTNTGTIALSGTNTARTFTLINQYIDLQGGGVSLFAPKLTDNGTGATNLSIVGPGGWQVTGANTYTGATTLYSGTLMVDTIRNGGLASNIGASSNAAANLVFDGGTLLYNGGTTSTDRLFSLGGGGTIDNEFDSQTAGHRGLLDFTNTGVIAMLGSGPRTLTLTSSLYNGGSIAGQLGDASVGATSLVVSGLTVWTLSGANTYTGTTTIAGPSGYLNAAMLSTTILANGGQASSIGASSNAAANLVIDGGTLEYHGAGANTDRLFTLGTGGGLIDAYSSSGALHFTNTGAIAFAGPNVARTLTLTSGLGQVDTFAPLLGNAGGAATSLTVTGAGTWVLGGANTYTGVTNINGGGTLAAASLANGGVASNIGASSNSAANLVLDGGTLQYTGGGASTERLFTLGLTGGSTLDASGTGALIFGNTGAIAFSSANNSVYLALAGTNTGANTLAALLGNNGTGSVSLIKSGTGTWTLTGANTYTGATTINGGVLSVASLANGGSASNLGASSNAAVNLVFNGGTLRYTGAAASTNRLFTLSAAGGTLDASGSGALTLTNTGSLAFSAVNTSQTLTLAGTNTGANILAALIGNNGSGSTSLVKSGIGTWVLSGAGFYSGGTAVNAGTLVAAGSSALGTGAVTVSSGSTLQLQGNITVANALTLNGTGTANNGALENVSGNNTASGAITLGSDTRIASDAGTLTLSNTLANGGYALTLGGAGNTAANGVISGSGALTKDGTGTATLAGANTYTGATTISGGVLSVTSLANGGSASGLGNSSNAAANLVLNGGTLRVSTGLVPAITDRLFTLAQAGGTLDSASSGTVQFTNSGAIVLSGTNTARTLLLTGSSLSGIMGSTLGDNGTGATSLVKSGSGNWSLTGNNTFTGGTTINAGSLVIGNFGTTGSVVGNIINNASLVFNRTNNQGYAGIVSGTGNLVKASAGTLTLSGASTYTGTTTVQGGILSVSSLANGTATSNIGSSTNAAANLVLNGGTLQYTGGAASTDRLFTLGITAGSALDASGSGALNLTNTGTIALSGTNSARALTLTGTNTGANTLAAVLANNGSGPTSLAKSGTGTWVLNGASSYTGGTTVSTGTLQAAGSSALGTGSATVGSGATLQATGGITLANALSLNGTGTANNGAFQSVSGNNTVNGPVTLAGNARLNSDAGTLTVAGSLNNNGSALTVGGSGNTAISGQISGAGSLIKDGAGTLTLSSATGNTFAGPTTVSAGILSLTASNVLNNTSALSIAAGANVNLVGSVAQQVGALTGAGTFNFGTAGSLTLASGAGTFSGSLLGAGTLILGAGSSFTLGADLSDAGLNLILAGGTLNLNGHTSTFGNLNVTGNSVIDFGSSSASILSIAGLTASAGTILSVNNWTNLSDYFYSSTNPGSQGSAPMNQVVFNGFSGSDTRYMYGDEIKPVPEPAQYGAALLLLTTASLAWRRRRRSQDRQLQGRGR